MNKILVDRLNEGPERIELDAPPVEFDLTDDAFEFPGRVRGHVEFSMVGKDVRGVGELELDVTASCVRCLDPAAFHLNVPVDVMWLHHDPRKDPAYEAPEDEILAEYYDGESIDPTETLRELMMFELPDLPKCSEDCKGLCPRCGANLNREPCQCPAAETSGAETLPWKQALKQLKQTKPKA